MHPEQVFGRVLYKNYNIVIYIIIYYNNDISIIVIIDSFTCVHGHHFESCCFLLNVSCVLRWRRDCPQWRQRTRRRKRPTG